MVFLFKTSTSKSLSELRKFHKCVVWDTVETWWCSTEDFVEEDPAPSKLRKTKPFLVSGQFLSSSCVTAGVLAEQGSVFFSKSHGPGEFCCAVTEQRRRGEGRGVVWCGERRGEEGRGGEGCGAGRGEVGWDLRCSNLLLIQVKILKKKLGKGKPFAALSEHRVTLAKGSINTPLDLLALLRPLWEIAEIVLSCLGPEDFLVWLTESHRKPLSAASGAVLLGNFSRRERQTPSRHAGEQPECEAACQFSVLQEPHESHMTHIKQSDGHREHHGGQNVSTFSIHAEPRIRLIAGSPVIFTHPSRYTSATWRVAFQTSGTFVTGCLTVLTAIEPELYKHVLPPREAKGSFLITGKAVRREEHSLPLLLLDPLSGSGPNAGPCATEIILQADLRLLLPCQSPLTGIPLIALPPAVGTKQPPQTSSDGNRVHSDIRHMSKHFIFKCASTADLKVRQQSTSSRALLAGLETCVGFDARIPTDTQAPVPTQPGTATKLSPTVARKKTGVVKTQEEKKERWKEKKVAKRQKKEDEEMGEEEENVQPVVDALENGFLHHAQREQERMTERLLKKTYSKRHKMLAHIEDVVQAPGRSLTPTQCTTSSLGLRLKLRHRSRQQKAHPSSSPPALFLAKRSIVHSKDKMKHELFPRLGRPNPSQ
ncbi:hypothetical protein EYF80_013031 [Liparis tanakae]|uniref:Uncharacterized protein n=1 Tax=Liparis tanakae TaxID=230148 RepID=A0A4Z2IHI3_9TELE|nr:hypothetical protein EYF80_013031 [Liparis tanakae]